MENHTIYASFNKQICPLDDLKIPVLDRAYFFGDAVYEVFRIYAGNPFLFELHLNRLTASLSEMGITGINNLSDDIFGIIKLNQVTEGMVYLQVSRGGGQRSHSFYNQALQPNVFLYAKPFLENPAEQDAATGIKAITHEDLRWGRCNIKSVNLLANCLALSLAHQKGAHEAILIRDGLVTEGSSCNVFMVKHKTITTRPLSTHILSGTRRLFLLNAFKERGYHVEERAFAKEELFAADEVFISSSIKEALPIIEIDQQPIGNGQIGPIASLARRLILEAAYSATR